MAIINMENKRIRSQNFTNQEKTTLLNIIYNYKDLVENKKTDGVSSIQKKKIWDTIATEFNAACPDGNCRGAAVLRKFYENKKKEVRKVVANEKTEMNRTGGGPAPVIKKDDTFDLILSIVNHKTVFGLENKYSNLTDPPPSSSTVNIEEIGYAFSDNPTTIEVTKEPHLILDSDAGISNVEVINEKDEHLSVNQSEVLDINQNETEQSENASDHTWKRYTPTKLKENISSELTRKLTKNECNAQVRITSSSRKNNGIKRPATVVRALTSSTVAEKYDLLLEKRLEIATTQQQSLEKELYLKEQEVEQKNEEHLKRMHLLDLEIKKINNYIVLFFD